MIGAYLYRKRLNKIEKRRIGKIERQLQQPLQGWANPGPWALFSIVVLMGCAGFFQAGLIPPTTAPLLVGILVACLLPQLIAGLINFQRVEILIGTLNGIFGTVATIGIALTTWMLISAPEPGAIIPEIMDPFNIVLFIAMEIAAVGFGRMNWFIMLGMAEVGVVFVAFGLWMLVLDGWLLIIFAIFCLYLGAAILWAKAFQKTVLPLGRPVFRQLSRCNEIPSMLGHEHEKGFVMIA